MRRAAVPIAFSQGFTPHPKISYASAAPTGVGSEAEYLEIGLRAEVDPDELRVALDAALSPGLDVLEAVVAGEGSLADRIDASRWVIEQSDVPSGADGTPCAIIELVVRQVTPAVRPDDVLSGLRVVAGLEPPVPSRVTRLAQGTLTTAGDIVDPLDADRTSLPSGI